MWKWWYFKSLGLKLYHFHCLWNIILYRILSFVQFRFIMVHIKRAINLSNYDTKLRSNFTSKYFISSIDKLFKSYSLQTKFHIVKLLLNQNLHWLTLHGHFQISGQTEILLKFFFYLRISSCMIFTSKLIVHD